MMRPDDPKPDGEPDLSPLDLDELEAADLVDLVEVFDLRPLTAEQREWAERARLRLRRLKDQLRRKDRK